MKEETVKEVYKRAGNACEVCMNPYNLEIHHIIYGSGKRKQHERPDSLILLCSDCHRGTYGVHGKHGAELNRQLKVEYMNKLIEQGYTEEETREMMGGKLPLTDEDIRKWERLRK